VGDERSAKRDLPSSASRNLQVGLTSREGVRALSRSSCSRLKKCYGAGGDLSGDNSSSSPSRGRLPRNLALILDEP
jgi:hypothetical protein